MPRDSPKTVHTCVEFNRVNFCVCHCFISSFFFFSSFNDSIAHHLAVCAVLCRVIFKLKKKEEINNFRIRFELLRVGATYEQRNGTHIDRNFRRSELRLQLHIGT